MNDYKTFPPQTRLSTIFLSALYPSPPLSALHAPPCLSTKHLNGLWVLVRSLELARGWGVGGVGRGPRDRYDDFIPELDARAWGGEREGGMKEKRWMQQSPVLKSSGYEALPKGRMTSGHPLPSPPQPLWLSPFNMKHFVIKKNLASLLKVRIYISHRLHFLVF